MAEQVTLYTLVVSPLMENVYFIADDATKECIVVDPGAEGEKILAELERLGLKTTVVVNTHGHIDHIGAVADVVDKTGAPYAIHPADLPLVANAGGGFISASTFPGFRQPPTPDRQLKDGDTVTAGGVTLTVVETPGHTPGSICLLGHGMLVTGDTLFRGSIGRYDLPGGDGERLMLSIRERLLPLPEETRVYPGHGPDSTLGREKRYNPFLRQGFRLP